MKIKVLQGDLYLYRYQFLKGDVHYEDNLYSD